MTKRMELTPQERYDIVAYRIECAENTLSEIDNLLALRYYNNAVNRMYLTPFLRNTIHLFFTILIMESLILSAAGLAAGWGLPCV